MSRFQHKNVLQLFGVALRPAPSMIMEFMSSGDLHDLLQFHVKARVKEAHAGSKDELGVLERETVFVISHGEVRSLCMKKDSQRGFIPSRKLDVELKRAPLSWKLKIRIMHDVANGMQYLHQLKPPVIHRDLRCPNIFLTDKDLENDNIVAKVNSPLHSLESLTP
jgi:serine/threonine protein kinase